MQGVLVQIMVRELRSHMQHCCYCLVSQCVQHFTSPWTTPRQTSLSFTISQNLLKLMYIESLMQSNHLVLCCPLLLLPSIFPNIRIFSNESVFRVKWPKYWSFSISSSNKYSGLISFRIDQFDLLAVQGILKNLLQHQNLKASILGHSAFLMVRLTFVEYLTSGKTIVVIIRTLVSKVMCLFVIVS